MAAIDWSDPCARAAALSAAYYEILSGKHETEIRTRTLDAEEMARFGVGDLDRLRGEMASADAACRAAQNLPKKIDRHAITAGFRRHRRPFGSF